MTKPGEYIGVDLDGTLATHYTDLDHVPGEIGEPVPAMVERVLAWLAAGEEVRIVTARVADDYRPGGFRRQSLERNAVKAWCIKHLGQRLDVQAHKDYQMRELWDDRAVTVERNTGRRLDIQEAGK